jgi:hypothetical protein
VAQADGDGLPTEDVDPVVSALREELEALDRTPVDDHVAVFEKVNATIARELAQLDEV